jgi:chromosome segregation protein
VSQRFGANFAWLFNGGTAQLALVSKGDTVGVEIQAQPPGKRLGNLSLLSGGERALTSCALLFALIQAGGAPFCVLDEVDAALDESNVGRFCDLLEELARDTQFIVVTHNRGTIERASRLYGVSMEASGISKVLSLQLEEVASHRATA